MVSSGFRVQLRRGKTLESSPLQSQPNNQPITYYHRGCSSVEGTDTKTNRISLMAVELFGALQSSYVLEEAAAGSGGHKKMRVAEPVARLQRKTPLKQVWYGMVSRQRRNRQLSQECQQEPSVCPSLIMKGLL